MYSRLVVPLVCAAAIVFACGPRTHTGAPVVQPVSAVRGTHSAAGSAASAAKPRGRGDTIGVAATLGLIPDHGGVRLALQVVNLEHRSLEIDFPDGRTRDFVVLDAAGREVWRWSRGRLFTQTVQNAFLAVGDTAVFEGRWEGGAPGQYTAVAILRSKNFPVEQRLAFDVQPAGATVAAVSDAERR